MTSKHRPKASSRRRRRLFALTTAVALCALAGAVTVVQVDAAQAATAYTAARDRLDADLDAARAAGYTDQQLAPVPARADQLGTVGDPIWVSDRPGYFTARAAELTDLRDQLHQLEASVLAQQQRQAADEVQQAASGLKQATDLGADPRDLAALHSALARAEEAETSARRPRQLAVVISQARAVLAKAQALSSDQESALAAIQQAAAGLKTQAGGDVGKLRQKARAALAAGRNDASVAAYMNLEAVARPYDQLERYSAVLQQAGSDADQVALAAAGAQHYQQAIHVALLAAFPHQVIVVSHEGQELWAYQDGQLVKDTLVTTGRPQLPTDLGAMKVLSKSSPFTMRSPWPKSSPWWYPDTKVQMVLWFTVTGEGLHDAYWEWDSAYGAGSEYGGFASHGCIHVPLAAETWLFNWAKVGTPVIVYPGDGSPVASQVAQISVDADGNPTTGPKGV